VQTWKFQFWLNEFLATGYRARGGEPLALTAEGPTRDAAIAELKKQLQARLQNGAEIVSLDVGCKSNPFSEFVDMFQDDPLIDDWKRAMADYRRKIDDNPGLP
jgi:hypothetical protein